MGLARVAQDHLLITTFHTPDSNEDQLSKRLLLFTHIANLPRELDSMQQRRFYIDLRLSFLEQTTETFLTGHVSLCNSHFYTHNFRSLHAP